MPSSGPSAVSLLHLRDHKPPKPCREEGLLFQRFSLRSLPCIQGFFCWLHLHKVLTVPLGCLESSVLPRVGTSEGKLPWGDRICLDHSQHEHNKGLAWLFPFLMLLPKLGAVTRECGKAQMAPGGGWYPPDTVTSLGEHQNFLLQLHPLEFPPPALPKLPSLLFHTVGNFKDIYPETLGSS